MTEAVRRDDPFLDRLEAAVRTYLVALDHGLTLLSHGHEGELANLPSWALTNRRIVLAAPSDGRFALVRIIEDASLDGDVIVREVIASPEQLSTVAAPWELGPFDMPATTTFRVFGDLFMVPRNPLKPPLIRGREMVGFGGGLTACAPFTEEKGKDEAIELWNARHLSVPADGAQNFVMNAKNAFDRFSSLIRRKAFVERRVHRFLAGNARLFFPVYRRHFSECPFRHGEETCVADLVLEREAGLPGLLVELEPPTHRVVTRSGDWTKEVNHARGQMADWDRLIQMAPDQNATGELSFLQGRRDRLVIIGRGLEHRQRLLDSRYEDTVVWTYDLLLEQAKTHWNEIYAEQCRLVGLPVKRPF